MAFSMFLRSQQARTMMFSQQLMKMTTQSALKPAVTCPAVNIFSMKNSILSAETAPLLNTVRFFKTSPVRLSDEKPHDHAKLWVIEKATSAILVPLIPIALIMPNKIFDSVLAILVTAHSFWGLEAIAVDYVRASIFGPIIPKIAIALVYLVSIATLGGLFYVITHDIGIANTVRQLWAIKSEQRA